MENSGLTLSVNHKGGAPAKDGRMEIFARRPRMAEKDPAISFTRAPNPSGVLLCRIPGGVKTSLESQGGPGAVHRWWLTLSTRAALGPSGGHRRRT